MADYAYDRSRDAIRVGELIRTARGELGLNRKRLADDVGVSVSQVSRWESGAAIPPVHRWSQIAKCLKKSVEYLFPAQVGGLDPLSLQNDPLTRELPGVTEHRDHSSSRIFKPDRKLERREEEAPLAELWVLDAQGDEPELRVIMGYGSQSARIPETEQNPAVRFSIQPTRLEITPVFNGVQPVAGTFLTTDRISYGLFWTIDATSPNETLPIDGERLVKLRVTNSPAAVHLTVRCRYDDLKVTVLDSLPDLAAKDMRVLERALQQWGIEPGQVYAELAKGALREEEQ